MNKKDLQLEFRGLATQNSELLESTKKLNHQLETVAKELSELKKEREEKMSQKEAHTNRKRLPKRDLNKNKLRRLNSREIRELLSTQAKLTKKQRLLKSVPE